jgi:hypothetical protein
MAFLSDHICHSLCQLIFNEAGAITKQGKAFALTTV